MKYVNRFSQFLADILQETRKRRCVNNPSDTSCVTALPCKNLGVIFVMFYSAKKSLFGNVFVNFYPNFTIFK